MLTWWITSTGRLILPLPRAITVVPCHEPQVRLGKSAMKTSAFLVFFILKISSFFMSLLPLFLLLLDWDTGKDDTMTLTSSPLTPLCLQDFWGGERFIVTQSYHMSANSRPREQSWHHDLICTSPWSRTQMWRLREKGTFSQHSKTDLLIFSSSAPSFLLFEALLFVL